MPTGKVKWYDAEKGFGFLSQEDGEDVYVRSSALPAGVEGLKAGQKVEFGLASGRRGPQALSLKLIDPPPTLSSRPRREGPAEHKHSPDELHGMVEDMITLLEGAVQPELRKGRYPDRRSPARCPTWSRQSPANWTPDLGACTAPRDGEHSDRKESGPSEGSPMAQQAQVSEEQARAVAEESRESGWDKPSLAKELFLGRFPLDLIHPFPRPTDDEAARTEKFLGRLREFLGTVDGSVIERDAKIPDEYVKGLADLGCFGMKIPSEYGGLNLSQVAYNRALMMVSSVHASLGALLSAHQSIGVPEPLKLAGSDDQKRKFLPRCAAGAISAFLLTEPDVGSDPARLASRRPRSTAGRPMNWRG